MSLRQKTFLFLGLAFVILIAGLYLISSGILLSGFSDLEASEARQDVDRALDSLDDDLSDLARVTRDWASWDDTYAFIEDHNPEFIDSNLKLETSWINNRLSLMAFVDSSGRQVFTGGFDLNTQEMMPLPESFQKYAGPGSPLLEHPDPENGQKGIILLPEGPMLVASEPILTSERTGPSRGTLIWGRYLDPVQIAHLARVSHLSLSLQRLDEPLSPDFQAALSSINGGELAAVQTPGDNVVAGYSVINDIFDEPALILRADNSRDAYHEGQSTMRYLVISIIGAGLLFGVASFFFLEKWVLSPVARLSTDVDRIGQLGDPSARVETFGRRDGGRDELSLLSRVINTMLAGLQDSQHKLKRANDELEMRVQERTVELSDRVAALQALTEIDREVTASIKSPSILNLVCRRTAEVLRIPKALIFIKDAPPGKSVAAVYEIADSPDIERDLTNLLKECQASEPAREKECVMDEIDSSGNQFPHLQKQELIRSAAAVPLFAEGHNLGFLAAFDTQPHHWTQLEIQILELIGAQLALALDQTRLFEEEQDRREELSSQYELSRALADAPPVENAILDLVTRHAVETVHVTFCRIAAFDDGSLRVRAAYPVRKLDVNLFEVFPENLASHGLCDQVLEQNSALIVHRDDARLSLEEREGLFMGLTDHLCLAPLRMSEDAYGILMLGESRSEAREPFTEEKIRLAYSIADQTISALHRARLFEQLEHSYLETVLSLAMAVEAKDTYTASHAENLAEMATAIGREIGMSQQDLEDLRYGAMLHDVGKIGVSDGVLQKPGRLSEDDWREMKKHPVIGEQILKPVPRLAQAAKIVRHHHERYDGSGYPDGLSGTDVPLGARVLTVVDSFSAIIDERVYKEARPVAEALQELRRCSGSQFDPEVVEIFTGLIRHGKLRAESYAPSD